jgi:hypothetical protein
LQFVKHHAHSHALENAQQKRFCLRAVVCG